VLSVLASGRDKMLRERMDSVLTVRYQKSSYDSVYVIRPSEKWMLSTRINLSGNNISAHGTIKEVYSETFLETERKTSIGLNVSYRILSATLSFNLESLSRGIKDYEFNLNYYGNRFGIDASYQKTNSLNGDIKRDGTFYLKEGFSDMRVVNIAAYYAFNHRRFSYPAAFTQSYIQRRSAGSWLAGISYQGGRIKNSSEAPDTLPQLYLRVNHFGIGGGYGYNFVKGKWLLHASIMPTIVVYKHNMLKFNGERKFAHPVWANMLFNEHFAVIYNFPSRHIKKVSTYFIGATAVMNNSLFDNEVVVVNQNKWYVRSFVGMRL